MKCYRHSIALVLLLLVGASYGFAQATNLSITSINGGSPVAAGPPSTFIVTVTSQAAGLATPVITGTTVTVSLNTGTGTLGGTVVGTILAGQSSVDIGPMTYTKAQSGVILTATATGGDVLAPANSSPFTVVPGPVASMQITVQPGASATAGSPFSPQPSITLFDLQGNTAANDNSTQVTAAASGGATATLQGSLNATSTSGVATFSNLSYNIAETITLQFTSGSLGSLTSNSIVVAHAAANKLVFITSPGTSTSGSPLSPSPVVEVEDQFGNPATGGTASPAISITLQGGTGTLGGTTSSNVNTGTARATFNNLTVDKVGSGYTLQATRAGVTNPGTSGSFSIVAGSASAMSLVSGDNLSGQIGSTLGNMTVLVTDGGGNPVSGVAVTFAVSGNPVGASGMSVAPGSPTTGPNGQASSQLTLGNKVGAYSVQATVSGLTGSPVTFHANATAGSATTIAAFSGDNQSGAISTLLGSPVVVLVTDGGTNPVSGVTVSFAITGSPAGATGMSLSSATSVTGANGQAGSQLTLGNKAGQYTVAATVSGLAGSPVQFHATATPGSATQLAFGVQPGSAQAGVAITPAVTVQILDAGSNLVTGDTRNITLSIGNNPSGGTLGGTKTVAASGGIATFSTLTVDKVGAGYTLTASSAPALTTPSSASFNITTGGARAIAAVSGTGQSDRILHSLANQFVVRVTDIGGNPVSGIGVNFSITGVPTNATQQALSTLSATSDASGLAGTRLTLGDKPGTYSVAAASGSLTGSPVAFSATATSGLAAILTLSSGDNQTGPINTALGAPFVVSVTDSGGNPVSGTTVNFAIDTRPAGATGDNLSAASGVTGANGQTSTTLITGNKVGQYVVSAAATGLTGTPVLFHASVGAGPAATIATVSGDNQSGPVGSTLTAMTVLVSDAGGNPVSGVTVNFAITLSPAGATGMGVSPASPVTGANGQASSQLTLGTIAGQYTVRASSGSLTGSPLTFHATANPGIAGRLKITQQPAASQTAGQPFSPVPTVQVQDNEGNLVSGDQSNVTAILTAGQGTLQGTTTVQAANGIAVFPTLSYLQTGQIRVRFFRSGLQADSTVLMTVNPDTAYQLVMAVQPPALLPAGVAITPAPAVQLRDRFGNAVAKSGVPVTFATERGPSSPLGTLTQQTGVTGLATFADLRLNTAGTYRLLATSPGLVQALTDSFKVVPGAVDSLVFTTNPSNGTAGTVLFTAPVVELRDIFGNARIGTSTPVTVALTLPAGAVLSGTLTLTSDATTGRATFPGLSVNKTGGYTLTATAVGVAKQGVSSTFTIDAAAATRLAFIQQPTSTTAGVRIQPSVSVAVQDTFGNTVSSAAIPVTLTLSPGATVSFTRPSSAGIAVFDSVIVTTSGAGKQLLASSPGLTGASSVPFLVRPAAAARLLFSQQPGGGTAGVPFARQPVVTVQDQYSNAVTGNPQTVTVALRDTATRGASLLGSSKSIAVDTATGRAAFAGLAIDKAGRGYTLTVYGSTVATLPGVVVSDTLTINPGAAKKLRVETAANGQGTLLGTQNVSSGTSITVYAVARDTFDNYTGNIAADPGGWALTIISGSVVSGDLVPSGDRLSAVFSGNAEGQARITVAKAGLIGVPSDILTVVHASAAAKVRVETADNGTGQVVPAQTLLSGRSLRVFAITRDAADNFISNSSAAWSVARSTGGVADSDLIVSPDSRSALFTGHKVGKGQIVATSGSLASTRSDTLTVLPGTVARLLPVAGTTPQNASAGTAFAVPLAAQVRDSSDNPVPSVLVRFAAPVTGPSGTFAGRVDTVVFAGATGVATSPVFTANSLSGSYADSALVHGAVPGIFQMSNGSGSVHHFTLASTSGGSLGTQVARIAFNLRITARDSMGNVVTTFAGTVDVGPSGSLVTGGGTTVSFTAGELVEWPVAFASAGKFTITARRTGGTEQGVSDTITVVNPSPTVASISPTNGHAGETLPVTITGSGFISGVTVVVVSDAHISSSVTVNSFSQLTATLRIDSAIVPGPKDVTVANLPPGGGATVVPNGFIVGNNPVPTLSAIAPVQGQQFQTFNVGFTGTNFLSGSTTVNFGQGITLNSVTVDSGSHLTAGITITGSASVGPRQVTVVNRPPGGGTSQSATFTVQGAAITPPTLASPVNGVSGQALIVTLQWNAPATGVTSYQVQVSTLPTFAPPLVLDDSTVTGTSRQISGLQAYTAYYWRVRGKQSSGAVSGYAPAWVFTTIPVSIPLVTSLQFPVNDTPDKYQPSDYRMVGIPGSQDTSLSTYFTNGAAGAGTDWIAYWDNGAATNYLLKFTGSADTTFWVRGGKAFWALQRSPWSLSTTVKMMLPDSSGVLRIRLHAGWNLITNPFPFRILWAQVQRANNSLASPIYAFDGNGMSKSLNFDPYVGYYFDNDSTVPLTSLVVPYGAALTAAKSNAAPASDSSWSVDIALERGGVSGDRATWFGAAPGASEQRDRLDFHKPRMLGPAAQVIFDRPAWDSVARAFASDIRPPVRDVERWTLQVRIPGKELQRAPHTLRFSGVQRVPARFSAFLVDDAHERYNDLREVPSYLFTPAGEVNGFTILVGDPDAVRKELERVIPKTFALDQNFPNPFNPSTTIAVNVPFASAVTVVVYNILGEQIRTVQSGPLDAGRYLFRWDGNNDHGSLVGTGVYLCRMSASGGPTFVRKMLLLK